MCQLLTVVYGIKFWTAYKGDMVFDECLMEIAVSVSSTICGNEQITAVEIRRIRCDKFNLNRPLGKLTFRNSRCRSGRYGICLRMLKQVRLVKTRRDGKVRYYSLADEHIQKMFQVAFEHIMED